MTFASRGPLRDCEIFANLRIAFFLSSSGHTFHSLLAGVQQRVLIEHDAFIMDIPEVLIKQSISFHPCIYQV